MCATVCLLFLFFLLLPWLRHDLISQSNRILRLVLIALLLTFLDLLLSHLLRNLLPCLRDESGTRVGQEWDESGGTRVAGREWRDESGESGESSAAESGESSADEKL